MKAIKITSDFSGYPDGKTERVFVTCQEPDDLDDAYADLLVRKELAEEIGPSPAPAKPPAPAPAPASPSAALQSAVEPARTDSVKKDETP